MCWDGSVYTSDVGGYRANGFGLHDVIGNVHESTEDCRRGSYTGAPSNGSAWTAGSDCGRRVMRGGSWGNDPWTLRAAMRNGGATGARSSTLGLRVARTLLMP